MKAVLIRETRAIPPFRSPLEELSLTGETLRARARRQLHACGVREVLERDLTEVAASDVPALVVWPSGVVSDEAMALIVRAARAAGPGAPFEAAFRDVGHEVLSWPGVEPKLQPVPLRWCGRREHLEGVVPQRLFGGEPELAVPVRLAEAVYGVPEVEIRLAAVYGRRVETWADMLVLSSLRAREHSARVVRPWLPWLPRGVVERAALSPVLLRRMNRIGARCRIHPTAVLEGCVIGDDVEIGPHCYVRASWVGHGATVREGSTLKVAVVEPGAFVTRCDVFNAVIGAGALIVTDMLYNALVGAGSFVGGGSGFSDFHAGGAPVALQLPEGQVSSGLRLLASAVGEGCFIGAGLLFRPGLAIPAGTRILSAALIDRAPGAPDGCYVASGNRLVQVPAEFFGLER